MNKRSFLAMLASALIAGTPAVEALAQAAPAQPVRYSAPRIVRPAATETIFDNTGAVPVEVSLDPPLRADDGHRLRVLLDGALLDDAWSTARFSLQEVDRGTHTLKVVVTDRDGKRLAESEPVEFAVWRASKLFPGRRKPPEER